VVTFQVSTTEGVVEEYSMADSYKFGPSGRGNFTMKFSYHEIQYITISGLSKPPSLHNIIGYKLSVNLTKTGDFSCSSDLMTRIYDTTVRNYLGITTGGMTVDCPHRERRGYGGDGHTSYEFALQNFGVGSFFNKWTRDFADTQEASGDVPHTAPTVGGGGGPAWSGFVVTNPWETYKTYGDKSILENMYPTMVRQLAFFERNTHADGLLHPWSNSMWDFLGDWITPHGSESNVTSAENILFNSCYYRYILGLTSEIATILGDGTAAAKYQADADALAAGINKAYYDNSKGLYLDALQTHQVMPLASGVVSASQQEASMATLQHSIEVLQDGHLDTGLTGTYFMTKYLTEQGRNDLVFTYTNQTTFPSYGYFLEQGYTTWPETWAAKKGVSKMHGCYNAIGLWFIQGIAGILVDASNHIFPLTIRAGVDAGDLTSASGSREALTGMATSSWSLSAAGFNHNMTIPANTVAQVLLPAVSAADVREAGKPVASVKGVTVSGAQIVNKINYVVLEVRSGEYTFTTTWTRTLEGTVRLG